MRKATETHTLDCNADTFWRVFLDEEYNQAFFMGELKFRQREVLELTDTKRRIRVVPTMNMPKAVEKVLGDSFGYEEVGTLDRDKNLWTWQMTPNTLASKLTTKGTVRLEPIGDDKVKRIDEVSIEAKIFGVGGLIEKSAEAEVRTAWSRETPFLTRWLKDHAG